MIASREIRGVRVHSIALYIVVVLVIILYGWFLRRLRLRDHLARPLYSHPLCPDLDGWSVTHFLFFGLLGVLFPGRYLQFLIVGAGWEVIETILGQNTLKVGGHRLQLIGDQDASGRPTGDETAYWYGKSSDIIVDFVGYTLGSTWAERYWPDAPRSREGPTRAPEPPTPLGRSSGQDAPGRADMFPSWI